MLFQVNGESVQRLATEADVAEIYQLRRLLEPAAFADAVAHATGKGVGDMRAAMNAQRAAHAEGDVEAFAAGNGRFRQAWLAMVPNRRLVAAVALYGDHVQILRVRLRVKSVRKIVLDGLARLVKAAEARDVSAAQAAMASHVAGAEVEARILAREHADGAAPMAEVA